ncbi:hypothetical protein QQF64_020500 [Cirrhinus molitorella]|uniref:ribonuclease H n=1 Tax=Cirrhinus molitorella TaxID=172907 RepID=A0ABR3LAU4_9TELE
MCLFVNQQPNLYPTDESRIAFVCSLLTGRALDWATTVWTHDRPAFPCYAAFVQRFKEVFQPTGEGEGAGEQLVMLRQGRRTAADYALTFHTLAAQSGWNDEPLKLHYRRGLNHELQSEMACRDEGLSLDQFIEQSIRLHNLIRARRPALFSNPAVPTTATAAALPDPEPMQLGATRLSLRSANAGSEETYACIVDYQVTSEPVVPQDHPAEPVLPVISWKQHRVTHWSPYCHQHCMSPISIDHTSSSPLDHHSESELPPEYQDLHLAFSKTKAAHLPPHRPGDCAIDLITGAQPPRGRIFPLSQPESEAMKDYIREELANGFIRPSTSPASASFFFVKKKDGGLRPRIDYHSLNDVTIKYRYPLPLVPSALEQLHTARIFTKLDLRSAYNLIRIH